MKYLGEICLRKRESNGVCVCKDEKEMWWWWCVYYKREWVRERESMTVWEWEYIKDNGEIETSVWEREREKERVFVCVCGKSMNEKQRKKEKRNELKKREKQRRHGFSGKTGSHYVYIRYIDGRVRVGREAGGHGSNSSKPNTTLSNKDNISLFFSPFAFFSPFSPP